MLHTGCILAFCYTFLFEAGHPENRLDSRAAVCMDVVEEAERQGVDPMLAVSVAHVESGFRRGARSHAGAVGPMQVIPRFWCKSKPCNHIEAGVRALRTYTESHGEGEGLCRYVSGRACRGSKTRRRYRDKVLRFKRSADNLFHLLCTDGC